MRLRRFLRNSGESGFTLLELLVALVIGLLVTGMTLGAALSSKTLYTKDLARTGMMQDIRGAMDLIGSDARVAGQYFNSSFPALQIVNGLNGAPDQLRLYRNLLYESLKVCAAITKNTAATQVVFATGTASGCVYSANLKNYQSWKNYRTVNGPKVLAYIFNTTTNKGEYFNYNGETDSGTQYIIKRDTGIWANDYDTASSTVYILEEWNFGVSNQTLQLVVNNDSANPYNVAFGIAKFNTEVVMQDGTLRSDFTAADDWTLISNLKVTLSSEDVYRGKTMAQTLSAQFFPRNVLSN